MRTPDDPAAAICELFDLPPAKWRSVNQHVFLITQGQRGGLYAHMFRGIPGGVDLGFQYAGVPEQARVVEVCWDWRNGLFERLQLLAPRVRDFARTIDALATILAGDSAADVDAQLSHLHERAAGIAEEADGLARRFAAFAYAHEAITWTPEALAFRDRFGPLMTLFDQGPVDTNIGAVTARGLGILNNLANGLHAAKQPLERLGWLRGVTRSILVRAEAGRWGAAADAAEAFAQFQPAPILHRGEWLYDRDPVDEDRDHVLVCRTGGVEVALVAMGDRVITQLRAQVIDDRGRWRFQRVRNAAGWYHVINRARGDDWRLDVRNARNRILHMQPRQNVTGQSWMVQTNERGDSFLSNLFQSPALCIDLRGALLRPGSNVSCAPWTGAPSQVWRFV